jgi:hypothetical protein
MAVSLKWPRGRQMGWQQLGLRELGWPLAGMARAGMERAGWRWRNAESSDGEGWMAKAVMAGMAESRMAEIVERLVGR